MEDHDNYKEYKTETSENDKKQSTRKDDDDEIPTVFPFLLGEWKDKKRNDRITVIVQMPSGTRGTQINPKIEGDGTQCVICFKGNTMFLDVQALLIWSDQKSDGNFFFGDDHINVESISHTIQNLRQDSSDREVVSVIRIEIGRAHV